MPNLSPVQLLGDGQAVVDCFKFVLQLRDLTDDIGSASTPTSDPLSEKPLKRVYSAICSHSGEYTREGYNLQDWQSYTSGGHSSLWTYIGSRPLGLKSPFSFSAAS